MISIILQLNRDLIIALETLNDAFVDELRDILSAEKQLVKALPKMVKAAHHEDLKDGLNKHLEESKVHVERLEEVFQSLELAARAKKCDAMEGLLEEASSLLEENSTSDVLDALLIAAAQKVEHYEIATYGTLCSWAKLLGHTHALRNLKLTLNEEELTDKKLSDLSVSINEAALNRKGK